MKTFRLELRAFAAACCCLSRLRVFALLVAIFGSFVSTAHAIPSASYPQASACAGFEDEEIEPGSTPTFPGLWVNPEYYGTGWHIDYQDQDDSMSFSWFTFNKEGRPVWFQSTAQGLDDNGTMFATLHAKHATQDGSGWVIEDAPESDAYLTIRVIENDPSLLAIKWQWSEYGSGWHQECINDVTRVGPFFVGNSELSAIDPKNPDAPALSTITPNAALTGLYREPALSGWGVAWTVLQVPQLGGLPAKYSEAAHLGVFDDDGNPAWLETETVTPTDNPPSAEIFPPYNLNYITRNEGFRFVPPPGNGIGKCTKAQAAACLTRRVVGVFDRIPQSAAELDVSIRLFGAPMSAFDRPDGFGFVSMEKVTAQTQLVVDRAACVIPHNATKCFISVDWSVQAGISGPFTVVAHVATAGVWGYDIVNLGVGEAGHAVLQLLRSQSATVYLNADDEPLEHTTSLRAIDGEAPPILTWNSPASCESEANCTVLSVAEPLNLQVSASAGENGIARVEIATGDQTAPGPLLCGPNPTCIDPLPGGANRYGLQWSTQTTGKHYFWARAQSASEEGVWSDWTLRTVKLGVPPAVQLQVLDRDGDEIDAPFDRADPLALRATVQNSNIVDVEFFAQVGTGEPEYLGHVSRSSSQHPIYVFSPWYAPNVGPYRLTAVAVNDLGLRGTSAPVDVTAQVAQVTLEMDVLDSNELPDDQFEAGSAWDPYFHLTPATQLNKHRFSKITARVLKNNAQPVLVNFCSTSQQCECAQVSGGVCDSLAPLPPVSWSPTSAGTYTVQLEGLLESGGAIPSASHTIYVVERGVREIRLVATTPLPTQPTLVIPESPTEAIIDPSDANEALGLQRTFVPSLVIEQGEIECAILMRESEYSPSATCLNLASSFPFHRCDGGQCQQASYPQLRSQDLCPDPSVCATTHRIIAVAKTRYDGLRASQAITLRVADAKFLSANPLVTMEPDQQFDLDISIKNTGSTSWSHSDYRLMPASPHAWGHSGGIDLPENLIVLPGETLNLEDVPVTAPGTPGEFAMSWRMARKQGAKPFGETYSANVIVIEPEDENPIVAVTQPGPDPTVTTPAHNEFGAIAGSGGVSGGAATYDIPIVVPPGRRGMQPSVSLSYNSRNGNGVVGMGWQLQAASSIHVCPRTVAQDGYVRAVQLDSGDALCLDGQRLVVDPASPVTTYGTVGAYYRTEIDSLQRIVQTGGSLGSGSERFELKAADGSITVYGRKSLTKPLVGTEPLVMPVPVAAGSTPRVMSWLISHRVDTLGNGMDFNYVAGGAGEVLLESIKYTSFDDVLPASQVREVLFSYEDRPDRSSSYIAGYRSSQTQRLKKVETLIDKSMVRQYNLEYEVSDATGRSLLKSVEECAVTAATCRDVTTFGWHSSSPNYELTADPNINQQAGGLHEYIGNFGSSVRLFAAADYDGNGARDILWHGPASAEESDGLATRLLTLSPDRELAGVVDVTGLIPTGPTDPAARVDYRGRADFNLDGRPELLGLQSGQLTINFWAAGSSATKGVVTPSDQIFTERWLTGIQVTSLSEVHYVGDVDGKGAAEIVVASGPTCSSQRKVTVYRKNPLSPIPGGTLQGGVTVKNVAFSQLGSLDLVSACTGSGGSMFWAGQRLERVADFNGDGLVDFWISDNRQQNYGRSIALAVPGYGTYGIASAQPMAHFSIDNTTSPAERHRDLAPFWMDVNGDGLDDWLYPTAHWVDHDNNPGTGPVLRGRWTLRMNVGGKWGVAKTFMDSVGGTGIEFCGNGTSTTECEQAWNPWRANKFRQMDTDADGRLELLVPTSYQGRMCTFQYEPDGSNECLASDLEAPLPSGAEPEEDCDVGYPGETDDIEPAPSGGPGNNGCDAVYYCPEQMLAPNAGSLEAFYPDGSGGFFAASAGVVAARNRCGTIDLNPASYSGSNVDKFRGLYSEGAGMLDYSSYNMTALRFVETAAGIELQTRDTGLIAGQSSLEAGEDIYGDGLADLITKVACYGSFGNANGGRRACGMPISFGVLTGPTADYTPYGSFAEVPIYSPDGRRPGLDDKFPFATPAVLVNENRGAADIPGVVPDAPDMMWMVTDGLGRETVWSYAPLGSNPGRDESDRPLYALTADRVQDSAHINFTSSMHVVSDMEVSDGVSLTSHRLYKYSYTDALYEVNGRGFRGFRSIVEEDDAAGTRVETLFEQVFPLTGKPKEVKVYGLSAGPSREEVLLSNERSDWACKSTNLHQPPNSTVPPLCLPYLARRITQTFDAGAVVDGEEPTQVSESWEIAAAPIINVERGDACSTEAFPAGAPASVDVYGNVTDRTKLVWDVGADAVVKMNCERTQSHFTSNASQWWINRLDDVTVSRSIEYVGTHDAGLSSINKNQKTQRRDYNWNAQRLLDNEVFQENDAAAKVTTTYSYSDHGLPETVTVSFNDLTYNNNGVQTASVVEQRTSTTLYDLENGGYFPNLVTNALLHEQAMEMREQDGQPAWTEDANDIVTTYTYDAFGTLTQTSVGQKAGMTLAHPTMTGVTVPGADCPSGATGASAWMTTQRQRGAADVKTCFDLLGRTLRVVTDALGTPTDSKVKQDTRYDTRGHVIKTTEPYIGSESGTTEFTAYSGDASEPAYDVLGRPFVKNTRKSAGAVLMTRYDYEGRATDIRVRDAADTPVAYTANCTTEAPLLDTVTHQKLRRVQDSLGRYVKTVDANGCTTRFWHDALGNVAQIEDAKANRIRATYNAAGHRTSVNDPNQGLWTFSYNAIGELRKQVDARQASDTTTLPSTRWFYDDLGRSVTRVVDRGEVDGTGAIYATRDTFEWDPENGKGQLGMQKREYLALGMGALQYMERQETYGYDAFARRLHASITQAESASSAVSLGMAWSYDTANGRLLTQTWNEDEGLWFVYDAKGRHVETRDGRDAQKVYWKATRADAWGNVSHAKLGQQIDLVRQMVPYTGQVDSIEYKRGSSLLQRFDYDYDVYGNLTGQALNGTGLEPDQPLAQEAFSYDILHRLRSAMRSGSASDTVTYTYEHDGNIKRKLDYGSGNYAYGSATRNIGNGFAGPNAVRTVPFAGGNRTMAYDLNGNQISATGGGAGMEAFTAAYDANNLPVRTQLGSTTLRFGYGPDHKRGRQWGAQAAQQRLYMEGYEATPEESKYYVGDYALITRKPTGRQVQYLATDRLGSVTGVLQLNTQGAASVLEGRGFDAFGKPRQGDWQDTTGDILPFQPTATPRGFTAHEHLDGVKLIHMNGRAFDYGLGRFLSVDPFIQFPLNSQSFNSYSYILNNPLNGTDPTGYCSSIEQSGSEVTCEFTPAGSRVSRTVKGTIGEDGNVKFEGPYASGNRLLSGTSLISVKFEADKTVKTNQVDKTAAGITTVDRVLTASSRSDGSNHYTPTTTDTRESTKDEVGIMYDQGLSQEDRDLLNWAARSSGRVEPFYGFEENFLGGRAVSAVLGLGRWAVRIVGSGGGGVATTGGIQSAANAVRLEKQLASQAQMSEAGEVMAGAGSRSVFRNAQRIAQQYGGNAADWVKKTSSSYLSRDGTRFETHWVENIRTGQRVELKTKFPEDN